MNKQIITILTIMLSITFVFAMISGTNKVIEFTGLVSECYILNNQSDLIGLELIENGTNVIISTDITYKPDNFSVSCLVEGQRQESSGSSGGGSAPSGWSAKCGYNKDCLNKIPSEFNYTKLNETIEPYEPYEEDTNEPIIQEEDKSNLVYFILGIMIIAIVGIIYWFNRDKSEDYDNYDKEVNENE